VAYHEADHALVAGHMPTGSQISIIPRGIAALGYTQRQPTDVAIY
jgi:cell division protease FtsH